MRRSLIIAVVVIALIGLGVVAYFYFANNSGVTVAPHGSVNLPSAGQATPVPTGEVPSADSGTAAPVPLSARLVKISAGPVVPGAIVIDVPPVNASSTPKTIVTYLERRSGNIFSYDMSSGSLVRTSNRTVPGIQDALWLPDASAAFVRYLSGEDFSTINTYALPSNGGEGFFLPQNLSGIAVSSTTVLTLASGVNGSVASLKRHDGTPVSSPFTLPLSALRVSFSGANSYLAFTKPAMGIAGSAFLIDRTGRFSRIAGPRGGLVALASPLGTWVLVSSASDSAMTMELVNTSTNEAIPLPLATIADKCVWAADNSALYCGIPVNPPIDAHYPDDWYKGTLSFSDRIWKIQVSGRYAQLVLDFSEETEELLDAQSLAVNQSGTALTFVNKKDGSLWLYKL